MFKSLLCLVAILAMGATNCPKFVYFNSFHRDESVWFEKHVNYWLLNITNRVIDIQDLKNVFFEEQNVAHIHLLNIKGVETFNLQWIAYLTNLRRLDVIRSDVRHIINTQTECENNFKLYANLHYVSFFDNKIISVDMSMFRLMNKLASVDFFYNPVMKINSYYNTSAFGLIVGPAISHLECGVIFDIHPLDINGEYVIDCIHRPISGQYTCCLQYQNELTHGYLYLMIFLAINFVCFILYSFYQIVNPPMYKELLK